MSNLQEVPTDDLLLFQDYPTTVPVHNATANRTVSVPSSQIDVSGNLKSSPSHLQGDMQQTGGGNRPQNVPDLGAGGDMDAGKFTQLIIILLFIKTTYFCRRSTFKIFLDH